MVPREQAGVGRLITKPILKGIDSIKSSFTEIQLNDIKSKQIDNVQRNMKATLDLDENIIEPSLDDVERKMNEVNKRFNFYFVQDDSVPNKKEAIERTALDFEINNQAVKAIVEGGGTRARKSRLAPPTALQQKQIELAKDTKLALDVDTKGRIKGGVAVGVPAILMTLWNSNNDKPPTEEQLTAFGKAVEKAKADNVEVFTFTNSETGIKEVYNIPAGERAMRQGKNKGGKFPDLNKDGKVTQADVLKGRGVFQEGGEMAMPPELMEQDVPVDTYPNMTPEEEAMPVASDEQMQEDYVDYVTAEVLTQDEQNYLNSALDNDPQLEGILDKVVTYAAEFTGEGEVDGPGTGISDSIPARLSDGEFVITEKATDQIGADNLQTMMDEAERAADGGMMQKYALGGAVDNPMLGGAVKDTTPLMDEKTGMYGTTRQDDEMKKQMMYANRMPSIIGR
tara:strand:- start:17 stop:1375 length:1359 start_codon:yes stop_codon:yes gene_type:complete